MAPSRATYTVGSASDDDDSAPEALTLKQSKKDIHRIDEARQAAQSDAKRQRKEKNRRLDENLKRRARETRGSDSTKIDGVEKRKKLGKEGKDASSSVVHEESRNLESRMERAMREAQDEEDDEGEGWEGSGGSNVEGTSASDLDESSSDSDSDSVSGGSEDSEMESDDDDDVQSMEEDIKDESVEIVTRDASNKPKLDYLPDHLFSEALAKSKIPSKKKAVTKTILNSKSERKRRPATKGKAKDIIIGSKTLRTVTSKTNHIARAASRTLPPGKVRRFYEDRLNLKTRRSREGHDLSSRKAANIGVMRNSSLPATNFFRND